MKPYKKGNKMSEVEKEVLDLLAQPELGAIVTPKGVSFSLFSHNATSVKVCLFDTKGKELYQIPLKKTGDIWQVQVNWLTAGVRYGYRVDGPHNPAQGHYFNPHKLLLDPAAKQITAPILEHAAQRPYTDGVLDETDSAPFMPKCIVVDTRALETASTRPNIPMKQSVFYEGHIKGMTQLNPQVPIVERGTFAGLDKTHLEHLKKMGLTTQELLPVCAFATSAQLQKSGLTNYWGYDPVCFMAPHPSYLADGDLSEIKKMVQSYHAAGKEIILDVVYNHTGEGRSEGPALSFRGIDNASYYRLNKEGGYIDDTGCGNTLDLSNPAVTRLVIQSLRYWVKTFDIDGFRFDLATTLGRDANNNFDPNALFFKALQNDPVLSKVKLIAEPWDIGPNGYQKDNFPKIFHVWDDTFRDTARKFWKGDENQSSTMLYHLIKDRPAVNFITAHDGFTLNDLVSYEKKHNEANGENNRDGSNDNHSWNSGAEGKTDNPEINKFREQRAKTLMATLLLSKATPMILAGDERLNTQQGNNNPYNQDGEITHLHWHADESADEMQNFTRACLHMRKKMYQGSMYQISYLKPDGNEMSNDDYHPYVRAFGMLVRNKNPNADFLVVLNASSCHLTYNLPESVKKRKWHVLMSTAAKEKPLERSVLQSYTVAPFSLAVLKARNSR